MKLEQITIILSKPSKPNFLICCLRVIESAHKNHTKSIKTDVSLSQFSNVHFYFHPILTLIHWKCINCSPVKPLPLIRCLQQSWFSENHSRSACGWMIEQFHQPFWVARLQRSNTGKGYPGFGWYESIKIYCKGNVNDIVWFLAIFSLPFLWFYTLQNNYLSIMLDIPSFFLLN